MNDVDRLSKGGAAKRRGTGSFHIPHRLNSDERPVYEAAKKKGFLQVRGTGYRKGRKGHPLPNIYRQWCDAKGQPCIIIEQDATGGSRDVVVLDLGPLRSSSLAWAVDASTSLAEAAGARHIQPQERPLHAVPFDTIPVDLPLTVEQMLDAAAGGADAVTGAAAPSPEQVAAAQELVVRQGDAVRELKNLGLGNSHPEVQSQVQVLIKLKADLQELLDKAAAAERVGTPSSFDGSSSSSSHADGLHTSSSHPQPGASSSAGAAEEDDGQGSTSSSRQTLDSDHPFANVAIWQLPVVPLFFEADRPVAKQLAKDLMDALKV